MTITTNAGGGLGDVAAAAIEDPYWVEALTDEALPQDGAVEPPSDTDDYVDVSAWTSAGAPASMPSCRTNGVAGVPPGYGPSDQRVEYFVRALVEVSQMVPFGTPYTMGYLQNVGAEGKWPSVSPAFDTLLSSPAKGLGRGPRTDAALNDELERVGSSRLVFIGRPTGPALMDDGRVDPFHRDFIVLSNGERWHYGNRNVIVYDRFADELTNRLSSERFEMVRSGAAMMVRLREVAKLYCEGLSVVFEGKPAPSGRKQTEMIREALSLYGVNSAADASAAMQRFIDERVECLIAAMQGEADDELEYRPYFQHALFLGKAIDAGKSALNDLRKWASDLNVLGFIARTHANDPARRTRMMKAWLAFSSGSEFMGMADLEDPIEAIATWTSRLKDLLVVLAHDLGEELKRIELTSEQRVAIFTQEGKVVKFFRYGSDEANAFGLMLRYSILRDRQQGVSDFIDARFKELRARMHGNRP